MKRLFDALLRRFGLVRASQRRAELRNLRVHLQLALRVTDPAQFMGAAAGGGQEPSAPDRVPQAVPTFPPAAGSPRTGGSLSPRSPARGAFYSEASVPPKQWFNARELAERCLPGMPETERGIQIKAEREHWTFRKHRGLGGGRDYHIRNLPSSVREALQ
ncbi:DNA-binding protein [Algiphilus sp. W345]|uniref:DNA-binding protein n=1 Tax=Banduia mediterranea TaxID=3075609 RepID=A0ABU2WF37_9GAMM|nr:DNA-binding protein [Algiphilus sp. W345]MDT0496487.1 DNA-binding protein [Algiphilus sp. W345]